MLKTYKENDFSFLQLSKVVSLLGKILGKVIKEQEGKNYFNKIEKIRVLSKSSICTKKHK